MNRQLRKSRDSELFELALSTERLREFFMQSIPIFKKYHPSFNYAFLARRAGFSSRSYVRAIFVGERSVSFAGIIKISKALDLPKSLEELLTLFANIEKKPSKESQKKLISSKDKIKRILRGRAKEENVFPVNVSLHWPYILASLGGGASLKEIAGRSGVSMSECKLALRQLTEKKMVRLCTKTKKFYSDPNFTNFSDLGSDDFFKAFFIESLRMTQRQATNSFDSKESLFFNSVFSICVGKKQEISRRLQEVLFEFCEHAEDSEGKEVATVQVALY